MKETQFWLLKDIRVLSIPWAKPYLNNLWVALGMALQEFGIPGLANVSKSWMGTAMRLLSLPFQTGLL